MSAPQSPFDPGEKPDSQDLRTRYECEGCGQMGLLEQELRGLWLDAPLGLCCVWVHPNRDCAEAARAARGGGRFHKPGQ